MSTAERTLPTPVYAVVGAGDVVVQEAKEAYDRLRNRAETAQTRLVETRTRLAELPTEINVEEIRAKLTVDEFKTKSEELRTKVNKDELLKVAQPYIETATGLYNNLAERGEGAVERLRTQPVVQENLERVGKVYNEAVDLTEDALGAVSHQTRLVGERAATLAGLAAEKVEDAAVEIEEAGSKVKAEAKTAAQKIDGAAGTVEAKGRTAKASPAKRIAAAEAPAKPAAKKAPARKAPAKAAPKTAQ
ncbi:heparin-binding hemagglutinin [Gordonia sp. PP30]|uniref:heparin-binding hemagglutinin n=1 Tax=Gordonia sp. PP30 TaxID=2935861 RepID=UPI001FFF7CBA|nr:heparin-binding hemagglutinin [Gordonia sp. PP30]UQE74731.1 heparin-binding hemagglutinin [Gordonia sp. PP30]